MIKTILDRIKDAVFPLLFLYALCWVISSILPIYDVWYYFAGIFCKLNVQYTELLAFFGVAFAICSFTFQIIIQEGKIDDIDTEAANSIAFTVLSRMHYFAVMYLWGVGLVLLHLSFLSSKDWPLDLARGIALCATYIIIILWSYYACKKIAVESTQLIILAKDKFWGFINKNIEEYNRRRNAS